MKISNQMASQALQKKAQTEKEKKADPLYQACQEFESLFINEMFKSMRQSIPKGGLLDDSLGEDLFQGMLDEEIAKEAAQKDSFGLADMLYRELSQKKF